jgi:hypothetical protein
MKRIIGGVPSDNCIISVFTLERILSLFITVILLASCAPVKQQVDIHHDQIRFDSVALRVTAPSLTVRNVTEFEPIYTEDLVALSPLIGMIAASIEHASNISKDKATADDYKENLTKGYITDYLGQSFIDQIHKSKIFPISISGQNKQKQLLNEGYDALVIIEVEEVSLLKEIISYSGTYRLHVRVNAAMTDLKKGVVIWTKDETTTSDGAYTFDDYKANDSSLLLKELNTSLDKLAFRLSSYIVYSE